MMSRTIPRPERFGGYPKCIDTADTMINKARGKGHDAISAVSSSAPPRICPVIMPGRNTSPHLPHVVDAVII